LAGFQTAQQRAQLVVGIAAIAVAAIAGVIQGGWSHPVGTAVARALTRAERFNVVLVLTAAQITHLMIVAISTAAIYFLFGLVLLSPAVLARWTANGASDGTILGMTIPVPQSLIHMTLLLIALTFMYVSARSATDDEFKSRFLDPLRNRK
jgi:hypothetical protein